jgi:ubiquinone/menaquinone biosynthesis C-methylase UbiE
MKKNKSYALETGIKGAKRLKLLNELLNPHSLSFLNKIGSLNGKYILDVGCGTGIMACELAKLVGIEGKIIAIDSSKDQLDIAIMNAKNNKIENIEFVQMPIEKINTLPLKFDLIYCRFLLVHLQEVDCIIKKMIDQVKQHGIILFEEPSNIEAMFAYPESDIFLKYKSSCLKQTDIYDCDFSIGIKIFYFLKQLGYKDIIVNFVHPILCNKRSKDQLWLGIVEISSALIESKFMTKDEVDDLITDLKRFSFQDDTLVALFQHIQIAVRI